MNNLLRKLDIYGGKIQLYYNHKQQVQTTFGGIITVVYMSVFVFLVFEFGNNFFNGLNPFVIIQEQNKAYEVMNLTHDNFMFAWRMEDLNAELLDPDRTSVDFIFKHGAYLRNKTTKEWYSLYGDAAYKRIPFEKCNISMYQNPKSIELYQSKNFKDFYCVSVDEFPIGGYWDGDFIYAFYVEYVRCLEGGTSSTGKECKSNSETTNILSNYAYASFYYPTLTVDPSDYENPISLDVKNVFFLIDPTLKLTTYNRFQEIQMISDYGWMFEEIHKQSALTFSDQSSDYVTTAIADLQDEYKGIINSSVFYYDKYKKIYNRTYTKIQNVVAEVQGMLQYLTFFLAIIVNTYNKYYLEYDLINTIGSNSSSKDLSDLSKKFALANQIESEHSQNKVVGPTQKAMLSNNYLIELNNTASKMISSSLSHFNKDFNEPIHAVNEIKQIQAKLAHIETVLVTPARISQYFNSMDKSKQSPQIEIAQSVNQYYFLDNLCFKSNNKKKFNTAYLKSTMMDMLDIKAIFKNLIFQKKVSEIMFTAEQLSLLGN